MWNNNNNNNKERIEGKKERKCEASRYPNDGILFLDSTP
jgi:hypothetical protein